MRYTGERLVSPTYDGLRVDHLTRYMFAANLVAGKRVLDCSCGIGYGSRLLALAGCVVTAVDIDPEAIAYAKRYYPHERIKHICADATREHLGDYDVAVSFETIEHIKEPLLMLQKFQAPTLIGSVPNQGVVPWTEAEKFHYRHYTPQEFIDLAAEAQYSVEKLYTQMNERTGVVPADTAFGRNLVIVAHR